MAKEMWKPGNMLYPIPAVMVSCQRKGEKPNIITVAWAGNICSTPAMLSISVRESRYSYDIIKESGEFVVNLVNRKLTKAADWCGVRSGRDYDKFAEMNLTQQKSNMISAPGILESPVNIECKVKDIIKLGTHDMFIAEVMCVDIDDRYLDENKTLDLKKADLVSYSHGEYFALGEKLGKFGYSVAKKVSSQSGGKDQKTSYKTKSKKSFDKTKSFVSKSSKKQAAFKKKKPKK